MMACNKPKRFVLIELCDVVYDCLLGNIYIFSQSDKDLGL